MTHSSVTYQKSTGSRLNLFLLIVIVSACSAWGADQEPIHVVCIGDSIVSSYPMKKYCQGWGEAIKQKFNDKVTVHNLAARGRSTKSFIGEGLWTKTLNKVDETNAKYVFIEFGHNDNPGKGPERQTDPSPEGDYRINITRYIDDTRAHGATPILVTPTPRRWWEEWGNTLREDRNLPYAKAMIEVAVEKKCSVVDLNSKVTKLFLKLGESGSDYLLGTEGDWSKDNTHFSQSGALILAGMITEDLMKKEPELAGYLNPDGGPGPIKPVSSPVPADGVQEVLTNAGLSWQADKNTLGYAIYFGETNPPEFIGNLTTGLSKKYNPSELERGKTYYWRIDAVNQRGFETGRVWSFTVTKTPPAKVIDELFLLPEGDSRLFAGDRDANYGSWSSFWGRNLGNTEKMNTGIMKFSIPEKNKLLRAKLEISNKRPQEGKMLKVFGLIDGTTGENFDEETITYNNAPGIDKDKALLNTSTVELFEMPGGAAGTLTVTPDGDAEKALLEFIKQDTNGIVTFFIVSSTGSMEFYTKEGGTSDSQRPRLHLWTN